MGTVQSLLLFDNNIEIPIEFSVIPDNFPIPVEGIIGKDFIKRYNCILDYLTMTFGIRFNKHFLSVPISNGNDFNEWHKIPPRCEVIRSFRLIGSSFKDQVVDNIEIYPGIFIARSVVNPQNCILRILNTNDQAVEIKKTLKLETQNIDNYDVVSIDTNNSNRREKLSEILQNNLPQCAPDSLSELCNSYSDIFALPNDRHTINNFYKQKLILSDESPVYTKNYRMPHSQKEEVDKQLEEMLKQNIIEPSTSAYNSPILLVPKKSIDGEKKYRLCIDFRQLNKKLIPDKFPLPRIDEILDNLGKTLYFSKLDLQSGFWQIPLHKDSKHLTSFSTAKGSFQFNVLPFGLNIAPNSFARMMQIAFSGIDPATAFIYLDDVIVIGKSINHHLKNLEQVFKTCREKNLKLNPFKCEFMKPEIVFLGHRCTQDGILPDESKFDAIINYPRPKNAGEVVRFTAFCNYYRKFIKDFGRIAKPLNNLTGKKSQFIWTEECENSFKKLKNLLKSPPILQYPDFNKEFILTVDASKQGIGAVLSQLNDNGEDLPIAFASSGFNKADSNKAPIDQELLAIYFGIIHFRPYLFGNHFLVRSDHKPLSYLFSMKDPTSKFARIRSELTVYNFTIEHIKGKDNVAADALSRIDFNNIKSNKIHVLTRSMKSREITSQVADETDRSKPNIKETRENEDIRKNALIEFKETKEQQELLFYIRGRHRIKSHSFKISPGNVSDALSHLLTELDFLCFKRGLKNLKMAHNDELFKIMPVYKFKEMANTMKHVHINVMLPIKEIEDAEEKETIIKHYHEHHLEGGHKGQKRLYHTIRNKYKWKGMAKDIANYVKNCNKCRVNKPGRKIREKMTITETPGTPFERISIDTIGPFNSINHQKYAVTIICNFSKYLVIIPISNKEAVNIAKVLMKFILTYGNVKTILSDQGTEYMNRVISELTNLLKIEQKSSTAYHHETLGTVERSHRTLNEYLRNYLSETKDWTILVKYFEYCYNTSPNTSINFYTPFEIVFGRKARSILNDEVLNHKPNVTEYVEDVKNNLEIVSKKVKLFLEENKHKVKNMYDRKCNPIDIKVNDKVMLVNEIRSKFDSFYNDNYVVVSINDVNATIKNINSGKIMIVHKNRLRSY